MAIVNKAHKKQTHKKPPANKNVTRELEQYTPSRVVPLPTYDVIIIGAGPAGIQATIFLARAQVSTLLIGHPQEGNLYRASIVENLFGFRSITGAELVSRALDQMKDFRATLLEEEALNIAKNPNNKASHPFLVTTDRLKKIHAKKILICTGLAYKLSGAKGENELAGRGVHFCVACDAALYKNKSVAVVGHQNHAAAEALALTAYTKNITLISNGRNFELNPELARAIRKAHITTDNAKIKEFVGTKKLEKIKMDDGSERSYLAAFLALGTTNALDFALQLSLEVGRENPPFITADHEGRTSVPGVYAAGGCTGSNLQAAVSIGQGCTAAITIIKDLKGITKFADYS